MATDVCARCGIYHRYQFPTDRDGHKPVETGCVNTLLGVIERLRYENSQLREAALPIAQRSQCCPDCDGSGDDPELDRLLRALGLL